VSTQEEPNLRDRCGFWLGLAAFFAAIGAAGVTVAITKYVAPWTSAWFIFGAVTAMLGFVCVWWSLVLYVAHKHAEKHWCPDPRAHEVNIEGRAIGLQQSFSESGPTVDIGWLRALLRQINGDLREVSTWIGEAQKDGILRPGVSEFPTGAIWVENNRRLAELPERGCLYDILRDAYWHVARIGQLIPSQDSWPIKVQPQHDFPAALKAIGAAQASVDKQLTELGLVV
jgi:hypothetical protein